PRRRPTSTRSESEPGSRGAGTASEPAAAIDPGGRQGSGGRRGGRGRRRGAPEPESAPEPAAEPAASSAAVMDGASGPFAWRPPEEAPEPPATRHTEGLAGAAPGSEPDQGSTDGRPELRQVQADRGRPARGRAGAGEPGRVVRRRPERGLPRPRRADHGLRGGVRDGDLGRGRGEDHDGGAGLGLRPGEAGDRLLAGGPADPAPGAESAEIPRAPVEHQSGAGARPAPPDLDPADQARLEALQERIAVRFRRPELLREAMTHASWSNERGGPSGPGHDNERLEYLGDAVLELVVGEYLFRRFPEYDEGQLTQLRAALVNTISLARLAKQLQ